MGTLGIHWEADGHAKSPMRDIQPALAYAAFVRRAARPRMPAKGRCATFDRREETVCVNGSPACPRVPFGAAESEADGGGESRSKSWFYLGPGSIKLDY